MHGGCLREHSGCSAKVANEIYLPIASQKAMPNWWLNQTAPTNAVAANASSLALMRISTSLVCQTKSLCIMIDAYCTFVNPVCWIHLFAKHCDWRVLLKLL